MIEDDKMKKGISLALLTAFISGISVFLNSIGVSLGDPFVYTTIKNTLVGVFLLSIIFLFGKRKELFSLNREQWKALAVIGIIGGAIPFLLFFYGLSIGTAASSSFLYRALFILAATLGTVWLREKLDLHYVFGAAIIFLGNIFLLKDNFVFGLGESFVLAATTLWAIEYAYSRKTLESLSISPTILAFGRMAIGSIILIGFIVATGKFGQILTSKSESYGWALLSSLFLLGFVLSWYNALKHTTVSNATALLVLGGPITALLQIIFTNKTFTFNEGLGLLLLIVGVIVATRISELANALTHRPRIFGSGDKKCP